MNTIQEQTPLSVILNSGTVLRALIECSDELQEHAKAMIREMTDPKVNDRDRYLAAETLFEILFPYHNEEDNMLGMDLEHANRVVQSHDLPEDHPNAVVLNEAAVVLVEQNKQTDTFAARLEKVMSVNGLTQTALAELVGISQPAISLLLSRECRPQKRTVRRIADACGVQPVDLWPDFVEA